MKKTVKWLNKKEAKALGFKPKENAPGRKQNRYYLDNEKIEDLRTLRLQTNKREFVETQKKYGKDGELVSTLEKLQSKPVDVPENFEIVKISTSKTTGQQWIQYKPKEEKEQLDPEFDYLGELEKQLKGVKKFKYKESKKGKEGVITITDLHFGAYIQGMKITQDFSITILCDMLQYAAKKVNKFAYSKVHVHCLGDLIESFTGLNHKNSWKGLDKGMFGVSAIKLFVELFIKHFLSNINNLGSIKLVAGNHDRVTSDNNEDVDGGAAELVAWALKLLGYDIEFSTSVITHKVDGINYILNHGHLGLTKLSTQEVCWKYGEKGVYNIIMEGHLHSRIAKLSANQVKNFKMVMDDNVDCRRMVCPSLFTGNSYSEYGGWSTGAGFIISESNINKTKVDIYDISI